MGGGGMFFLSPHPHGFAFLPVRYTVEDSLLLCNFTKIWLKFGC
jgi:hypothetical protein